MNRLSILADISGRADKSADPITAAAVVFDTGAVGSVRSHVSRLPKWGECSASDAAFVIDLLASQAVAVSTTTVDRQTEAWRRFVSDEGVLQGAILRQRDKVAGWAKATNLLRFMLLCSACAAAQGHAIGIDRRLRILTPRGRVAIECSIICDEEVQGEETLEVFRSFWDEHNLPKATLARFGVEMVACDVTVTTDEEEPALIVADYVAGIGLASAMPLARGRFPLDAVEAAKLLGRLKQGGKLVQRVERFDQSYDGIFRDVMTAARDE